MVQRGPAAFVIVAAVALVSYAVSLEGTFHYDDIPTILHNQAVRDASHIPGYFGDPRLFSGVPGNSMYRPVLLLTYYANFAVADYAPKVWHLTNVLLHALNACLVLALTRRLLSVFGKEPKGWAPLLAGLAFALHPVHSEVVNYISSRSSALATAGFLGALILHLAWTRGGRAGFARGLLLAGSLALFALGLGGKEIAVAFVPVVFTLELLDPEGGPFRARIGRTLLRTLPAVLLLFGYLLLRQHLLGVATADVGSRVFDTPARADPYWGGGRTVYQNLLTQSRVFWAYVFLLFLPVDLALDRYVRVSTSVAEPAVLLALLGLLVLAAVVVWTARRRPLIAFCILLFGFGLAPTSTIIPLNVLMNEHRLYLPGIGFAILTGLALAGLIERRRGTWMTVGVVAAAVLAACYLGVVTVRNFQWGNTRKLWEANVESSPRSFRALNQLGVLDYRSAERAGFGAPTLPVLDSAIRRYRAAEEIYPDWYTIRQNLALAWQRRARITGRDEDFAEAARHYEKCCELRSKALVLRSDTGMIYAIWGKPVEARRWFAIAAEGLERDVDEYVDETFGKALRSSPEPRFHLAYARLLALREPRDRERIEAIFRYAVTLGHEAEDKELERLLSGTSR